MQRRGGVPKERHTRGKWEKPLTAAHANSGLQEQLDPGAHAMARIHGVFLPFSLFSSHLCFSSVSLGFFFKQIFFLEMLTVPEAPGFYLHSFRLKGKGTDLSLACFSKALRSAQVQLCLASLNQSQQPSHTQCSGWPGLGHVSKDEIRCENRRE